jgi:hypothetical protein
MNLELKDDDGTNIDLNGGYNGSNAIATPIYAFKMQVRNADTDQGENLGGADGYLVEAWAAVANRDSTQTATYLDPTNLATFTIPHGTMEGLASGVYVYDIEKRLFNTLTYDDDDNKQTAEVDVDWDNTAVVDVVPPDDVETILYGVFTVNEDITL